MAKNKDVCIRAMQHVLEWAFKNKEFFKENDPEVYGIWLEGKYLAIVARKLTRILKEGCFAVSVVLKEWGKIGWIRFEGGKCQCRRGIRMKDGVLKRDRFVIIDWNVVRKFQTISKGSD